MAKRAITLFAVDKKSKNRVSMVARTRGLKKAKKIEAASFFILVPSRRRRLKKRRRWFRLCAEWKIRLFSLSLLLRRAKKTRISMTMARLLKRNVRFCFHQEEEGEEEEEEEEALRKEGVFFRRERERER